MADATEVEFLIEITLFVPSIVPMTAWFPINVDPVNLIVPLVG